ncbi:flagellar hook-associated protein FlgK [Alicyclobacillus ferrooxydans]|uniref:Flagellar hook-associated protein 1 n=1 Tax=Alicyclobacillus ferrooxydans TaxID=471514 RepID=A0A0P9CEV9_9BACL|nr:flagellar hook-associated protein FlgK [Alicyclobacillus ferrooxydans]KPV44362.1 hypothetical protein AN477_06935 [Alicyclobacillus ferrooxydans]
MSSTFSTINIADSALNASVIGMNIASNNIANAQTPGYARETVQQTNASSIQSFTDHYTYMGQGVDAKGAQRQTNQYINAQLRDNSSQNSYWSQVNTALTNLQGVFNEPSGTSVRSAMDTFFSNWNQLSQNPTDSGVRATVMESAQNMIDAFNAMNNNLTQSSTMYQNEVSQGVSTTNTIAKNISELNTQIQNAQKIGANASSLEDQRDALLNQLSNLMPINVTYSQDSSNPNVTDMSVTYDTKNPTTGAVTTNTLIDNGTTPHPLTVGDVANFKNNQYGSLAGYNYMQGYATHVASEMQGLLAKVANDVNGYQKSGYGADGSTTGVPLFDINSTTNAVTIDSKASAANLAAAQTAGSPTDGSNALAISQLMQTGNYDSTYAGYVGQVADDVQSANNQQQTYSNLTTQLQNTQTAISGVDINQEMSNMIQYQQTYEASSKLISVYANMLNTLIQNA